MNTENSVSNTINFEPTNPIFWAELSGYLQLMVVGKEIAPEDNLLTDAGVRATERIFHSDIGTLRQPKPVQSQFSSDLFARIKDWLLEMGWTKYFFDNESASTLRATDVIDLGGYLIGEPKYKFV